MVFQSRSVPSISSSYSVSNSSYLFWLGSLRWVQLVLTTDWRSAFSYKSKIWTTCWVASCMLLGSCAVLLLTTQAFSIFDFVRLLMSLIGKMVSSNVISFVWKSKAIPRFFMVPHQRMRSYTGLVIFFLSYSTTSGVTRYSLLFEYSKTFKLTFLLLPLVRKLPFDVCQGFGACLVK